MSRSEQELRDENAGLRTVLKKMLAWVLRVQGQAEKCAADRRFSLLADASRADAKALAAVADEIRVALAGEALEDQADLDEAKRRLADGKKPLSYAATRQAQGDKT